MTDEDVFLPDDPRAATKVLVTSSLTGEPYGDFWISRTGDVVRDEGGARWLGATHIKCKTCGEVFPKTSYCHPCSERHQAEQYAALPAEDWTGGPIQADGYCGYGGWLINGFCEMEEELFRNQGALNQLWYHGGLDEIKNDLVDIEDLAEDYGCDGFEFSPKTIVAAKELNRLLKDDFADITTVTNKRVTFDAFRAWLAERGEDDDV